MSDDKPLELALRALFLRDLPPLKAIEEVDALDLDTFAEAVEHVRTIRRAGSWLEHRGVPGFFVAEVLRIETVRTIPSEEVAASAVQQCRDELAEALRASRSEQTGAWLQKEPWPNLLDEVRGAAGMILELHELLAVPSFLVVDRVRKALEAAEKNAAELAILRDENSRLHRVVHENEELASEADDQASEVRRQRLELAEVLAIIGTPVVTR